MAGRLPWRQRPCRSSPPRPAGRGRPHGLSAVSSWDPNASARVSVLGAVSPGLGPLHGERQDRSRAVRRGGRRMERTGSLPDLVARDRIDEEPLKARRDPVPRVDAVHLQGLRFPSLAIEDEEFLGDGFEQGLSGRVRLPIVVRYGRHGPGSPGPRPLSGQLRRPPSSRVARIPCRASSACSGRLAAPARGHFSSAGPFRSADRRCRPVSPPSRPRRKPGPPSRARRTMPRSPSRAGSIRSGNSSGNSRPGHEGRAQSAERRKRDLPEPSSASCETDRIGRPHESVGQGRDRRPLQGPMPLPACPGRCQRRHFHGIVAGRRGHPRNSWKTLLTKHRAGRVGQ